jgi:two-component system invasion response regulator UvrY
MPASTKFSRPDNYKIRVQLCDDHQILRTGVRILLENSGEFEVVCECSSGEQAYTDYQKFRPDVLLLDMSMPGEGGVGLLRRLLARYPDARVLVLSMYDDVIFPRRALDLGAKGYITKGVEDSVLVQAVRKVAMGGHFVESEIALKMAVEKQPGDSRLSCLSVREFEVFRLLAEGESVKRIAEILHLSPKTVGTHRTNIMVKLEIDNVAELTRLAIRHQVIGA